MSKQKRERALSNTETPNPRKNKAAKVKGLGADRDLFGFRGSSDGEIETTSSAAVSKGRVDRPKKGAIKVDFGTIDMPPPSIKPGSGDQAKSPSSTAGFTIIDTTLAKDYLSHETPAGSSSKGMPGSFETPHRDGNMPTPTISSRERSDNDRALPVDQTHVNLRSSAISALQTLPGSDSQQEPSSSASLISPSKIITLEQATTKKIELQDEDLEDELSRTSPIFHTTGTLNPIVLLPWRANDDTKSHRSKKTIQAVENISNDLGSDDIVKGAPTEQYWPHTSRSRAGLNAGELVAPVDFSKKPEAVAKITVKPKRKNKRSKTTGFQELRPPKDEGEDEEDFSTGENKNLKIPIWKDLSPKLQLGASIEDDGDGENRIVQEPTSAETEKSSQQPRKQRGRPRKLKPVEGDEPTTKVAEDIDQGAFTISRSKIDRVAKLTSKSDRTAELQPGFIDEDETQGRHHDSEDEPVSCLLLLTIPLTAPKGCLWEQYSFSKSHFLPICSNQEFADLESMKDPKDEAMIGEKVLEESAGNASKQASSPTCNMAPPGTPKGTAKATEKGPNKHSPISSGKVAYRVGLSKRTRIEPLLRIVRK